jgi:5-methylcytosine-specific restriction endonuclease McrA
MEIFERDGWICQLCLEPVDPELPRSNRMGATIDHIIPLSRGGLDGPDHVQLAHRSCNASKRAGDG